MAEVYWPAASDEFIPSSLTRIAFDDIRVDLDTSKHYIQVCFLICYLNFLLFTYLVHRLIQQVWASSLPPNL